MRDVQQWFQWFGAKPRGVCVLLLLFAASCKKDVDIIQNNIPPFYDGISDLKIENYINRVFIDVIGREPLKSEMATEVALLKKDSLSREARKRLVAKLQNDTTFISGDSSYKKACFRQYYNAAKSRILEGASDDDIQEKIGPLEFSLLVDSLEGNFAKVAVTRNEIRKLKELLNAQYAFAAGTIDISAFYFRVVNNAVYDEINMNTFNLIRASFDNLYFRYPTETEFWIGYNMVESNQAGTLFGQNGQNKDDYLRIITQSTAFYEGLIIYAYRTLLGRQPETNETIALLPQFVQTKDYGKVCEAILITDAYAGF